MIDVELSNRGIFKYLYFKLDILTLMLSHLVLQIVTVNFT